MELVKRIKYKATNKQMKEVQGKFGQRWDDIGEVGVFHYNREQCAQVQQTKNCVVKCQLILVMVCFVLIQMLQIDLCVVGELNKQ